jgi:hypothetical protein
MKCGGGTLPLSQAPTKVRVVHQYTHIYRRSTESPPAPVAGLQPPPAKNILHDLATVISQP